MSFFFEDRRRSVPPTGQPSPPVPPEPAPSDDAVLAYLDSCVEGTAQHLPRPAQLDLMDRALELASRDWLEDEAGSELAWLADYDQTRLEDVYHCLIAGLLRNPFPDIVGVRASRVAFNALEHCASDGDRPEPWS